MNSKPYKPVSGDGVREVRDLPDFSDCYGRAIGLFGILRN